MYRWFISWIHGGAGVAKGIFKNGPVSPLKVAFPSPCYVVSCGTKSKKDNRI